MTLETTSAGSVGPRRLQRSLAEALLAEALLGGEALLDGLAGPAVDPVEYLHGSWSVDRVMVDQRTGACGAFRGEAHGSPVTVGVLDFEEHGEMTWNGRCGPARRSLRIRRLARGRADVRFADGRHFHSLELGAGEFLVEHRCGADLYTGSFQLRDAVRWSVVWEVDGPSKQHLLATSYVRLTDPAPSCAPDVDPGLA